MTNTAASSAGSFRLSRLVIPVYLPTMLFAVGQGLIIPVIPLYSRTPDHVLGRRRNGFVRPFHRSQP